MPEHKRAAVMSRKLRPIVSGAFLLYFFLPLRASKAPDAL